MCCSVEWKKRATGHNTVVRGVSSPVATLVGGEIEHRDVAPVKTSAYRLSRKQAPSLIFFFWLPEVGYHTDRRTGHTLALVLRVLRPPESAFHFLKALFRRALARLPVIGANLRYQPAMPHRVLISGRAPWRTRGISTGKTPTSLMRQVLEPPVVLPRARATSQLKDEPL